jgi:hypothetical protein
MTLGGGGWQHLHRPHRGQWVRVLPTASSSCNPPPLPIIINPKDDCVCCIPLRWSHTLSYSHKNPMTRLMLLPRLILHYVSNNSINFINIRTECIYLSWRSISDYATCGALPYLVTGWDVQWNRRCPTTTAASAVDAQNPEEVSPHEFQNRSTEAMAYLTR